MFFSIAMIFTPWWIGGGLMFVEIIALMAFMLLPKIKEVSASLSRSRAAWMCKPDRLSQCPDVLSHGLSCSLCECWYVIAAESRLVQADLHGVGRVDVRLRGLVDAGRLQRIHGIHTPLCHLRARAVGGRVLRIQREPVWSVRRSAQSEAWPASRSRLTSSPFVCFSVSVPCLCSDSVNIYQHKQIIYSPHVFPIYEFDTMAKGKTNPLREVNHRVWSVYGIFGVSTNKQRRVESGDCSKIEGVDFVCIALLSDALSCAVFSCRSATCGACSLCSSRLRPRWVCACRRWLWSPPWFSHKR